MITLTLIKKLVFELVISVIVGVVIYFMYTNESIKKMIAPPSPPEVVKTIEPIKPSPIEVKVVEKNDYTPVPRQKHVKVVKKSNPNVDSVSPVVTENTDMKAINTMAGGDKL